MTISKQPARVQTFHLPVDQLQVQQAWHIGPVTIRPHGWLKKRVDRDLAFETAKNAESWAAYQREITARVQSATAEVRSIDFESARRRVGDALAVLKHFYRSRYALVDTEFQTFGLQGELAWTHTDYWITAPKAGPLGGWRRDGVAPGDWLFRREDHEAFVSDPTCTYLGAALRKKPARRDELERRLLTGLRVLSSSTRNLPRPLRIVLAAVAVEAVLGDHRSTDAAHRIAQRAAYLTCGRPTNPHGSDRPACPYLTLRNSQDLSAEVKKREVAQVDLYCDWYLTARDLFDARNAVLHDAADSFAEDETRRHSREAHNIIKATLDWITGTHATARKELDDEIRSLPAA